MKSLLSCLAVRLAAVFFALLSGASASAEIITFDDLTLAPGSHWSGPDLTGTVQNPGPFGGVQYNGKFTSGAVEFVNRFETAFGSWNGFAYSNKTDDTTAGFFNQYSSYAGVDVQPTSGGVFAVAFDVVDVVGQVTIAALEQMPYFRIPAGMIATGAYLTNTTYAGLSMKDGDAFTDPFGGPSGVEPDYLRVTAYGIGDQGQILSTPDFYLADYRSSTSADDYILKTWKLFDLSALAGADTIYFDIQTSDVGPFGSNTPMYFAIDDIALAPEAVPEPSSALLALTAAGVAWRFRRRKVEIGPEPSPELDAG